jgi:putative hydrolase of HD superfamily
MVVSDSNGSNAKGGVLVDRWGRARIGTMSHQDLIDRLRFIQSAERLKNVLRSGHTSEGRRESTPEHTWRLCLLAMVLQDRLPALDFERVLKICVVHDLGEALHGDVPAVAQSAPGAKAADERQDLVTLMQPLPQHLQAEFLALWDEYEAASTPEAQAVKALDKLETIIQHNQGANPPDFDYAFNLAYGQKHTATDPLFAELRALVDAQTQAHADRQAARTGIPARSA